ncbi:hypothetical protein [Piscinibacter terrae]|uniref:Uncharacterized protein n=1 Tax=Piscinibacter terrae TaxID=2496871 RepID=A0A3N7HRA9_9BURK|nr:hypothetical protein [Albitalea terrae]RQP24787.1 hypothetical protein DZC73_07850 [Albitalea terrae]
MDELTDWTPAGTSYADWLTELLRLWGRAKQLLQDSDAVVAVVSFEASAELQTFPELLDVPLDAFTPPSLYLLDECLTFPPAGEQYYRVLDKAEFDALPAGGTVIARSARSMQALANSWEFDNTLYIASRFAE